MVDPGDARVPVRGAATTRRREDAKAAPDRPRASQRRSADRRPRTTLTLEAIIERACRILDAEGTTALTLRRLAGDLRVGAASLYWYVDGRDELLELCYASTLEPVIADLMARDIGLDEWQAGLRALFTDLYDLLVRQPWVAEFMSREQSRGELVLRVWDRVGRVLSELQVPDEETFYAGSTLMGYLGAMSLVASREGDDDDEDRDLRLARLAGDLAALDPHQFPALSRAIPLFRRHTEKEQFVGGLNLILDGIAARVPAISPTSDPR